MRLANVQSVMLCALAGLAAAILLAGCGSESSEATGSAPPPVVVPEGLPEPQIVGGTPAQQGAYPFAAYIETSTDEDGDGVVDRFVSLCGGSLIGAQWVLTAAHCLPDAVSSSIWIGAERAGAGERFRASAAEGDIWVHPDYKPPNKRNDVALIRLDRAASQRAVSLVLADDDAMWAPGTLATIMGWGNIEFEGQGSQDLLHAQVPVVSDQQCAQAYSSRFDPATMVCAGGGTIDTCQGDSGGPIVVPYGTLTWFQFGVVSWGDECAKPGVPGVYSRMETLAQSVVSHLESDSEIPVSPSTAETGEATPARDTATLQGAVTTGGLATLVSFELRPADSEEYTQVGTGYAGSGATTKNWRALFQGLQPNTEYVYRVSTWSASGGVRSGEERSFTTLR